MCTVTKLNGVIPFLLTLTFMQGHGVIKKLIFVWLLVMWGRCLQRSLESMVNMDHLLFVFMNLWHLISVFVHCQLSISEPFHFTVNIHASENNINVWKCIFLLYACCMNVCTHTNIHSLTCARTHTHTLTCIYPTCHLRMDRACQLWLAVYFRGWAGGGRRGGDS